MKLELTSEETTFIETQLARRLDELRDEHVHTTDRAMKHELARDVSQLEAILARMRRFVAETSSYA